MLAVEELFIEHVRLFYYVQNRAMFVHRTRNQMVDLDQTAVF